MNILSASLPRQRSLWKPCSVLVQRHLQVCYKSTAAMDTLPGNKNSTDPFPPPSSWFLHRPPAHQQEQTSSTTITSKIITTKKSPTLTTTTTSMQKLVQQVPLIVKERKDKNITPGSPEDPIVQLFRHTRLSVDEWSRYAFFDSSRPYTRNLIATDHQTYTLLLLCWNPQHESPIHDHPCDGCWLQVLKGTIQECRYRSISSSAAQQEQEKDHDHLECTLDQTFGQGQIAYITDTMGYHKIGNPTIDQPAVSLHLYAPPIQECRTWRLPEDENGDNGGGGGMICETSSCVATHYSEYGFRVSDTTTTTTAIR